ncbi:hypothetical protein AG1IA_03798 [Rhizoctonia solani AG-1 IA]|uniref:Uncharacterized protein n=1 Tax=Thanatephorus cucumeris (strain AG1-IA) TaxID=983506 RepID=L8WW15_THACA|nr:hypothetical protein AG1IA_03798 [Rhizoctonia solani AG-1 IA]
MTNHVLARDRSHLVLDFAFLCNVIDLSHFELKMSVSTPGSYTLYFTEQISRRRVASTALIGFERNFSCWTRVGCHHVYSINKNPRLSRHNSTSNGSDNARSPLPNQESQTSKPNGTKVRTKPDYPPRPEKRPTHLLGRTKGLIRVAPASAHIPIDTSLPSLVFPDGTRVARPNAFRPPYLTERLARHLSIHINDPYVITRSIELFGSPRSAGWVANLTVGASRGTITNRTNEFLQALPWSHAGVKPFSDEAWAEHLVAKQNPRIRYGPDDHEFQEIKPVRLVVIFPSMALGYTIAPEHKSQLEFVRRTGHAQIDRFYSWDSHLIVVFASPAARRAILAAYAWWIRRKLLDAYEEDEKPDQPAFLPPVGAEELVVGGVKVEDDVHAALDWAKQVGWRPEYRIRPYQGRRKKNDHGEGWYDSEIETRLRIRNKRRELEERLQRERAERAERRGRKNEEARNVESETQA